MNQTPINNADEPGGPGDKLPTVGGAAHPATYSNPVHPRSAADPFVLKHRGEYWAYVTDFWSDGRAFGILRSADLVAWEEVGGAMDPLPGGFGCYWAPEVVYLDGRFLMYYSVGNEERMEIRVAVAAHPAGPFVDSGHVLTREPFAIDAHVFEDVDGARYLFYATDFLEHTHIGTGTVVDRMLDPFTLAGAPRPVTRARHDWQVYDPRRENKGGVRWHTVEGPTVLLRKGIYYEMFSGGNWQNVTYGVSYATASTMATPDEWEQTCDGERVLPILRTLPGLVVGPGHNSVVRGPDNRQFYCIYHRWAEDGSARVLCIDPLDWAGDRMLILGPTITPQPAPTLPTFRGFGGGGGSRTLGGGWRTAEGEWRLEPDTPGMVTGRNGTAIFECGGVPFLLEVSARASDAGGSFGVLLAGGDGVLLRLMIVPEERAAVIVAGEAEHRLQLPEGFDPTAWHCIRCEVDGARVGLMLDGPGLAWSGRVRGGAARVGLIAWEGEASFAAFEMTLGWEELFMEDAAPETLGWDVIGEEWRVADRALRFSGSSGRIERSAPAGSYELVVNARLDGEGIYGFLPAVYTEEEEMLVTIERRSAGWVLRCRASAGEMEAALPESFDPLAYQQFRFRREGGSLSIALESIHLGAVDLPAGGTRIGLTASGDASFEMVRLTALAAPGSPRPER